MDHKNLSIEFNDIIHLMIKNKYLFVFIFVVWIVFAYLYHSYFQPKSYITKIEISPNALFKSDNKFDMINLSIDKLSSEINDNYLNIRNINFDKRILSLLNNNFRSQGQNAIDNRSNLVNEKYKKFKIYSKNILSEYFQILKDKQVFIDVIKKLKLIKNDELNEFDYNIKVTNYVYNNIFLKQDVNEFFNLPTQIISIKSDDKFFGYELLKEVLKTINNKIRVKYVNSFESAYKSFKEDKDVQIEALYQKYIYNINSEIKKISNEIKKIEIKVNLENFNQKRLINDILFTTKLNKERENYYKRVFHDNKKAFNEIDNYFKESPILIEKMVSNMDEIYKLKMKKQNNQIPTLFKTKELLISKIDVLKKVKNEVIIAKENHNYKPFEVNTYIKDNKFSFVDFNFIEIESALLETKNFKNLNLFFNYIDQFRNSIDLVSLNYDKVSIVNNTNKLFIIIFSILGCILTSLLSLIIVIKKNN